MGDEWRTLKLGDVLELKRGYDLPEAARRSGPYPIVTSSGVTGRHAEAMAKAPGVVTGRYGSLGQVFWVTEDYWPHNTALYVRDFKGNDPRFISYLLRTIDFQSCSDKAAVPGVNRNHLHALQVRVPPLVEQKNIAQVLSALDDKIESNRRMNQTLEAIARAVFKEWFVDFGPVRAKMAGRAPAGLSPDLAALFPDKLIDSELGPVPEGWRVGTFGEVADNPRRGVTPEEIAPGTPYIALDNMPRRSIALDEWGDSSVVTSQKARFAKGEFLFGKLRPYFHKCGVAPVDGVCSTDIVVVAPRAPAWYGFTLGHLSSDAFVAYTNAGSTGTKMPRTSWGEMARFKVVIPDEATAGRYTEFIRPLLEQIVANIFESRTLAEMRDALLPKLVSGQVRVALPAESVHPVLSISPAPTETSKVRKTSDEFKEAILIAHIVRTFESPGYVVGRMRYNKLAYFAHRKAEEDVTEHYLKKAAGPYSPWARYAGPEKIAIKNGYIKKARNEKGEGFLPGDKIADIDKYTGNYPACGAVTWVAATFRYRKKEELELLATVDFAALELIAAKLPANRDTIRKIIEDHPDWAPKLNRAIFSDANIANALAELARLFPATIGA
jgi:type I restriction enzyme S subunit